MTQPAAPAPPEKKRKPVGARSVRGRLFAGLLIIIPVVITTVIVRWVFATALYAGKPLVKYFMLGLQRIFNTDEPGNLGWAENIVAVLLTLAMLYIVGWLGSIVVGKRLIAAAEALLARIPLVDTIYTSAKRILHALGGSPDKDGEDKQVVVLIDFPYPPLKALGFQTNVVTDANSGRRFATVFVPTTPNPTSGYMELVPIENVSLTNLNMEEALSTILSGGAAIPPSLKIVPPAPPTLSRPRSS
ncbi:MAG: DUF502 domain-containing protein [Phycisphaerae bacterium]